MFRLCINSVAEYTEDGHGLANRDLGPHNLLVDKNFTIVALIDLDFVLFAPLHEVASLLHKTWSELDPGSSDLQVMKRVKEFLSALEADRPDFPDIIGSHLATIWAELERLDHAFDVGESFPVELFRLLMGFAVQGESFVKGEKGRPSGYNNNLSY